MRTAITRVAVLASLFAVTPAMAESEGEKLSELTERYYDYQVEQSGRIEEANGSTSAGARLSSVTPEAQIARAQYAKEMLEALAAIDRNALTERERIDAAVFETLLQEEIGDARFREWEMPFDSDNNFWSYLAATRPLQTVEDYERYISRMRDLPRYFDENIANARSGLARGFSVPRVTLEGRDASLVAYVVDDPEESPFWGAFKRMPERFSQADADRLQAAGRAAIADAVTPAYRELLTFFRDEYLPQTRTSLAANAMPEGPAFYAQQIRQFTTLDMTAEEIHQIGLEEVARITAEMEKVKAEAGFEGTLPEFVTFLRTDPQFVADTGDELMGVSAYTAKRVDGELAKYFGFLPRHRFSIRPVDPAIAPFYTAGRGGLEYCQMNTYDLPSRPLYNIPALTLHECAPGHSFQAAIALEQPEAPKFRRQTYFSGFGEGWGLYTEYLGEEMGIYRTPYERFGRLSYEMWRAVRLVIDTGIHHYGWSREQAVDYLATRTALSEHEVNTEVDRYISWPGQALAYKLGEMTIRRVRAKAEAELGNDFDIRKFHDVILSLGSVPLPVLEERIDAFIADGGKGLPGVEYD
ncbi:Uncharacterized conserved protein, DUF885 familyt [Altererythrobacter xiamenensis]|uniref:Uncharacterized conserved protein, DUF885 familyt n=1 Tax=Altererythrobacter xiamenensis TaxID=1316679 RepID=A0A1Y6FPS7_9SPHN|nr:DUF885 family protein [Altererythrobacter xiamenensis]SMQ74493.1 Uncharacterized conserved protein, DUF885 familyt [Altererythrobacter xiamenensis]